MMRHRSGAPSQEESSSDEEDAFTALARKSKKAKMSGDEPKKNEGQGSDFSSKAQQQLPVVSTTSSMKRHHKAMTDTRKTKMDSLIMELEAEKQKVKPESRRFVPDKKGSFCEPGEERLTTNIFVGNLAPTITEEELGDLFRQFGDLYSVKIMWPRNAEERARNRHTGFVCFMNRQDAEDAMDACSEADPFNVGRRLMMRWGKNVKKVFKQGQGGMPVAPIQKKYRMDRDSAVMAKQRLSCHSGYDPKKHGHSAMRVVPPQDPRRAQFISCVASYVAKDGSELEKKLIEREANNPMFDFLTLRQNGSDRQKQEHVFYKWRMYAFCQGDGFHTWRTEPFVMFQPHSCYWIPPAVNPEAARQEEENVRQKEDSIRYQKEQRRMLHAKQGFVTGRQLEQARRGGVDGGATLNADELEEFSKLFREGLCASRDSVCEAMAFCFERSFAAKQIASMLKELLLEDGSGISVETRVARLYVLSDILFNSQQPGVRNAFLYRDAIEKMAPEVFTSLGRHGGGRLGRMTMNKLGNAVSSVLGAWTSWSVYNPTFMDELHDRFEGREVREQVERTPVTQDAKEPQEKPGGRNEPVRETIRQTQQGDWTTVAEPYATVASTTVDEESRSKSRGNLEVDGEPLQEDADGSPLNAEDADGEPFEDDADGLPMDEGNSDGEPLEKEDGLVEETDEIDGEPLG